jgi:lysophospholipid acyltransferase
LRFSQHHESHLKSHLHRQVILDEDAPMDHTAPMMVLVMKLSSFAWSCHDGLRPTDELSEYQRRFKIIEFPGLMTFLGYIFYFPTFLIGPTFQFNDYQDFVLNKPPFQDAPTGSGPALFTMLMALVPLGVNLTLMQNYGYIHMLRRGFMKKSFLVKLWYTYVAGFVHRCTFYAGWKLSEAASIWTGLGYMGKDEFGINRWYRIQNVNLRQIELAGNLRLVLNGWNMNTVGHSSMSNT